MCLKTALFFLFSHSALLADCDPPLPITFEFRGETFRKIRSSNLPLGIFNIYRAGSPKEDGSDAEITLGFIKTADCLAFAKENIAAVKKQRPQAIVHLFGGSDAAKTGLAHLTTDPTTGATQAEYWDLARHDSAPIARVAIFKETLTSPDARKILEKKFPKTASAALNEMLASKLPNPFFPSRRNEAVQFAKAPEGNPVLINQAYIDKVAPKRAGAPALEASVRLTIPKRFVATTGILGQPEEPEIIGFGQAGQDGKIVESVTLSNYSHPNSLRPLFFLSGSGLILESRLITSRVLSKGGRIRDRYWTEVNGLVVAVILAETTRPNQKPFYHQYVLIPRQNATEGTLLTIRIDSEKSPDVKTLDDLYHFKGFASEVLTSFSFPEPRGSSTE